MRILTREDGRGYLLGRDAYWGGMLTGEGCLLGRDAYWGGMLTGEGCLLGRDAYWGGMLTGEGCLLGRDAYWGGMLTGEGCLLGRVGLLGRDSGRTSSSRLTRGWSSVYTLPKDGVDSTSSALSLDTGRCMLPFSKARRRPMDIPVFNNCQ